MKKEVNETTKTEEPKKLTVAEARENLQLQISQYQTMLVKAQGALEVLNQLEEDNNDGK
jgi:hypothetical protein